MGLYAHKLTIIEPRAAQPGFVQLEAQRLHQVQVSTGVRTQANYVPGVGRYFRLVQDQAEHIV